MKLTIELMKRLSLYLFLLLLTLQTPSLADDIRDFQIEGISVGNSALDYFSESDIKKNSQNYYKNKKFTPVQNYNYPFFKNYELVDFEYKTGDKNYIIYSLSGIIPYKKKDIKNCYKKMDEIDNDISKVLKNFRRGDKQTWKHDVDPTGKSTFTDIYYETNNGVITITCYDFSKEQESKGSQDSLVVMFSLQEHVEFLRNNPY